MKIAVTGANGYLGSAIVTHLSAKHDVLSIARSKATQGEALQLSDLRNLTPYQLSSVECVIHAAGVASANADLSELKYGNVDLCGHLADVCKQAGVVRLYNLSSVKACGEGNVGPSVPDAPETDYGRSKLHGERAIEALLDGSETAFQSIRLPLMYSSNVTNNFSRLVSLVSRGWPLPIRSFTANRSYCCVSNILGYLECSLLNGDLEPIAYISDKEPIELSHLMLELAKANGKSLTTIPLPRALIQSGVRLVSTALARQLFEDAVVDISETVQRTNGWEPKDTVDCIQKEFGRDGRI
jgi:nucleoside-diphosphate-sugar epimerase